MSLYQLGPDKAPGIDEADKELYGENVSGNIMELVDKLKDKSDQPKPTKRVYVPKDNGDKRPLGYYPWKTKWYRWRMRK